LKDRNVSRDWQKRFIGDCQEEIKETRQITSLYKLKKLSFLEAHHERARTRCGEKKQSVFL
jgi:hypothetical protein